MIFAELKSKLRPWQPDLVEKTIHGLSTGNFLNASGLGSGKSYVTAAAIKALNKKMVVLCRVGAIGMWKEVACGHFGMPESDVYAINREQIKTGRNPLGTWERGEHNPETGKFSLHFKWNVPSDTVLVWDEIHSESSLTSQNSAMLNAAVAQGVKCLGLSGTAADDPRKMRSIGYMLGLHQDWDFWQWLAMQGASKDAWNYSLPIAFLGTKRGKKDLYERQLKTMEKIHAQLIKAGRMVRLPISAIHGFPKCSIQPLCIDFNSDELTAIYAEMEVEFKKLGRRGIGGSGLEVIMPRMRRAELLMVPEIVQQVEDAIDEGSSVVVFVNFKETVKALALRLKTDCIFTGDESQAQKDANRMRFERDESRVILVTSAAGGESVSFADRRGEFPRVGVVMPSFKAVDMNQLFGRLPRDGAMSPSVYRLLFARGTLMERAYHACKRRTELYGAFNGDLRFTDEDLQEGLLAA